MSGKSLSSCVRACVSYLLALMSAVELFKSFIKAAGGCKSEH